MARAGARLLAEDSVNWHAPCHSDPVRHQRSSTDWKMIKEWTGGISNLRDFYLLDAAINGRKTRWFYRHGGAIDFLTSPNYPNSRCCGGTDVGGTCRSRRAGHDPKLPARGRRSSPPRAGGVAVSSSKLESSMSPCPTASGLRTLTAGMAFGEMALLETHRSADVLADLSADRP